MMNDTMPANMQTTVNMMSAVWNDDIVELNASMYVLMRLSKPVRILVLTRNAKLYKSSDSIVIVEMPTFISAALAVKKAHALSNDKHL